MSEAFAACSRAVILRAWSGITVLVDVTGDDHRGRIGHALPNVVIRRVVCESCKVIRVFRCAEFLFPDVRVVEQVVTQHVQHRNHADHGAE